MDGIDHKQLDAIERLFREKAELEAENKRLKKAIQDALLCDTVVQMNECLQAAMEDK